MNLNLFLNLSYRYHRSIFFCLFLLIEAKAVNGSKFIHVHLRCETNDVHRLEENVRTLGSNIVERTGIPLEGNEIYVRTAQSESKEKGTNIYVFIF